MTNRTNRTKSGFEARLHRPAPSGTALPLPAARARTNATPVNACLVLVSALEQRHRNFTVQLASVRRRPGEPGVHDLRVATRRLITAMDLASRMMGPSILTKQRKLLRRFLKDFNDLRDTHILKIAIIKLRKDFPAAAIVLRGLGVRERELLRSTGRRARLFDTGALLSAIGAAEDALLRAGLNPALVSAARLVFLGKLAASFSRVVDRRRVLNAGDPATVHKMRVAFKEFRYSLEILTPLLPWMTADARKRLNGYQTAMGKVQDTVVVLEGITACEAKHPMTGRMALIDMRQHVLQRQRELTEACIAGADAVYGFWR